MPGRGGLAMSPEFTGARKPVKIDLVWLQGADEIDAAKLAGTFTVYQGHHGDRGAHAADVVLPGPPTPKRTAST